MTLLHSSRPKPPVPPEDDGRIAHHTLALTELVSWLERKPGLTVLDLGAASGGNLAFLSRYTAHLHIADIYQTLRNRYGRVPVDAPVLDRCLSTQLPAGPFDLVLVWDLLNYFDTEQLEVIGKHLARVTSDEALVFSLINTRRQMPDRPLSFEIADDSTLIYKGSSSLLRPGPGYKEPQLARCLAEFGVETSFLLRHGIQEYILGRQVEVPTAENGDDQ